MRTTRTTLSFSFVSVILMTGCATLPWTKTKATIQMADQEHPVERILCIWQTGEGRGLDNLPTRGFAGQIFFFTRNNPSPVIANGNVDVFLFDDQGTIEEQVKPIHSFEFTEEAWNRLAQKSQVGPAYSVFIPYVRKGQHEAQCALVVRLKPRNGPSVSSDMAYVTLRGIKKSLPMTDETAQLVKQTPADSLKQLGSRSEADRTRTTTVAQWNEQHETLASPATSIRDRSSSASAGRVISLHLESNSEGHPSVPRRLVQPPVDASPIPPLRRFQLKPADPSNRNGVSTNRGRNGGGE